MNDNLKLYCIYHKKELETHYIHNKPWFNPYYKPLIETEWFKPYFTLDNHINSLDKLQDIFCEFTAIYYIYKNQLISPYIGICHYDRQLLRHQIENNLLTGDNLFYGELTNEYTVKDCFEQRFVSFLIDDIFEYIKTHYSEDSRIYKYYITNYDVSVKWLPCMNFICKWEVFNELAEFLCNFIDWHNTKHNLLWESTRYKQYIDDNFTNIKDWLHLPNCEWWLRGQHYRVYAFVIEMLVGFYFGNLDKELNGKH